MSDSKPTTSKEKHCIHKQARIMAARIVKKCIDEKKQNRFAHPVACALDRAVYLTGISKRTLLNIQKEAKAGPLHSPSRQRNTCEKFDNYNGISKRTLLQIQKEAKAGPLHSPSRQRNKCKKFNNIKFDSFDRSALHECVLEFYSENKSSPTGHQLLAVVQEKHNFPWGLDTLRHMLRQMGYEWTRTVNNRHFLVENPDAVHARSEYLQKIRQYRQEGRNIFFMVETYLDSVLKLKRTLENEPKDATKTGTAPKNRLILVHAGETCHFLNGENLLTKASSTCNCDENNYLENWVTNILVPNLPPNSVIIMDYVSQNEQKLCIPSKSGSKQEMREWLTGHDIEAADDLDRTALYYLVQSHKSDFETDSILERHGYEVLKLPSFVYDLNPIEVAWAKIKRVVAEKINEVDLSEPGSKNIAELVVSQVSQVTDKEWRSHNNSVVIKEESNCQLDEEMKKMTDNFVTSDARVKKELKDEEIKEEADDYFSDSDVSIKMEFESD